MFPNALGASATFTSPLAAETVSLFQAITVGSISLTNNTANAFALINGAGGSLIFDQTGTANAVIAIGGIGNVVNALTASVTLNDTVDFAISDTATTNSSGALEMTGSMGGAGGVIKSGAGTVSFATSAKAYTGSTAINEGVLRISATGQMTGTSAVTVASGAQFNLSTDSGVYSLGAGGGALLTLNGTGPSSTGALIDTGSGTSTLANNISLALDSSVSVTGGTAFLQLNGTLSGAGGLTKVGAGTLTLLNSGSYLGATVVSAGTLNAGAANALGGTVGVTVNSGGTLLLSGSNTVADRINNAAIMTLSGGTFNAGGLSEGSASATGAGIGALSLTANSTIDFGAGTSILNFAVVGLHIPITGADLALINWSGLLSGGGSDQLLFTGLAADFVLTYDQSDVSFNGVTGYNFVQFTGFYEIVPVPEFSTYTAGLLTLVALCFSQRGRLRALIAS